MQPERAAVEGSPGRSRRKHAVQLELSDRSVRRILKLDFQFYPYPITKIKLWFQQDTATDHITQNSLDVLRENVSMRGDAEWPAQSPDLSIFYFE